jgi:hypothetical protein
MSAWDRHKGNDDGKRDEHLDASKRSALAQKCALWERQTSCETRRKFLTLVSRARTASEGRSVASCAREQSLRGLWIPKALDSPAHTITNYSLALQKGLEENPARSGLGFGRKFQA